MACAMFCLVGCGGSATAEGSKAGEKASDYSVAMITDYGDITDQSFNQTTYEACKAFSYEKPIYKYMLHGKVHGAILFYDIKKAIATDDT